MGIRRKRGGNKWRQEVEGWREGREMEMEVEAERGRQEKLT